MKALLLALTLIFSIQLASADTITGRVIGVSDGDTISVLDQHNTQYKIRLAGIDAPEKKQAFGNVSKQSLSDLVAGRIVTVGYNKNDRYGRIIGKVWLRTKDVNLEQVKRGLAWHYKKYEREQDVEDRSIYAQEEYLAQRDNIGLWVDSNAIAPWEFRKK